jgi:hypothetical protein
MCFYDLISTFVAFLTHRINLLNFFVDVQRIGMSGNDYDGRPLLIFHTAALDRNYIITFVYISLDNNLPKISVHEIISCTID